MTEVLVTGGTGTLGRALVPLLEARGHSVRVLSRRTGPTRGDVRTGAGLAEAAAGADVVVHAATSSRRRARATEVDGTRNLLAAVPPDCHVLYVSVVGADRNRLPYHRAKREAERLVEAGTRPWTIQRATQFHPFVDELFSGPVFVRTPNLALQPVDLGEVAARLVDLVDAGPSGHAPDFGGPEVLDVRELARVRRAVTGRAPRLLPLPPLGFLRDLDAGRQLCPEHRPGRVTWEAWLQARARAA